MRAVPLFVGSYLAVWALVGVGVYALYRPHGSLAAGLVVIAAGVYELTPLKLRFRRRCRESVRSGFEFGLYCVGSSIGLMLILVALSLMSVAWMAVIAVLALAQKLLPAKAAVDVPLALAIVALGLLILIAPSFGSRPHATDVTKRQEGEERMIDHKTGTREEWLAARLELLEAEKELTRRSDELAQQRRELPWVRIDKDVPLRDRRGRQRPSPSSSGGVRSSSSITSCSAPTTRRDVPPARRSRTASTAPSSTSRITTSASSRCRGLRSRSSHAYRRRMGWSFPWASSFGSDFNHDFQAAHTKEEWESGAVEYNFRSSEPSAGDR